MKALLRKFIWNFVVDFTVIGVSLVLLDFFSGHVPPAAEDAILQHLKQIGHMAEQILIVPSTLCVRVFDMTAHLLVAGAADIDRCPHYGIVKLVCMHDHCWCGYGHPLVAELIYAKDVICSPKQWHRYYCVVAQ